VKNLVRTEKLNWFGHTERRSDDSIAKIALPNRRWTPQDHIGRRLTKNASKTRRRSRKNEIQFSKYSGRKPAVQDGAGWSVGYGTVEATR